MSTSAHVYTERDVEDFFDQTAETYLSFWDSVLEGTLLRDFYIAGGRVVVKEFKSRQEIAQLPEPVVFNCTGLGSATLFDDRELIPVKGQLVVLVPQPEVNYTAAGMMPRNDGIVLGHVNQPGNASLEIDESARDRVLNNAIAFFSAMKRDFV